MSLPCDFHGVFWLNGFIEHNYRAEHYGYIIYPHRRPDQYTLFKQTNRNNYGKYQTGIN